MESLIGLVNRIQRVCTVLGDFGGRNNPFSSLWEALPTVAVVGGIVTRRPLVLQLHKTEDGSQEHAEFLHLPKRKYTDFELMLLGFISLLLTVSEKHIANICIPDSAAKTFLPCESWSSNDSEKSTRCQEQGKVSLLSREGVRQLQYLIFVFTSFHCLSSILKFGLGRAKVDFFCRTPECLKKMIATIIKSESNDPVFYLFVGREVESREGESEMDFREHRYGASDGYHSQLRITKNAHEEFEKFIDAFPGFEDLQPA